MISFKLSQVQEVWRSKAHEFAEKEIKPRSWIMDRIPVRGHRWKELRDELVRKLSQAGFHSMGIPHEYGGSGLDFLTISIVLEELAWGDAGIAFTATTNSINPILIAGTEEQKRKFFALLCDRGNPRLSAFALTEPGAGSDAGALSTIARRDNDEYVINGSKCFISNGASASLYTLFATVDRTKGVKGITAFIIPGNASGISAGKVEDKMGFRTSETAEIALKDVRIPKANRLGEEGEGFRIAMKHLDIARVLACGAIGVGLARAAYDAVLDFFNRSGEALKGKLTEQAISFQLVDMTISIEAARLMVWKSSWMLDQQIAPTINSAWAKLFSSNVAMEVTNKAVQLLGHHGYGKEIPLEKYMRDAKILQIYEGTNQIAQLVASRGIM